MSTSDAGATPTRLFTIGFTQTSAEHFFGRLQAAGVRRLVDVRLNNVSQLAGFAKKSDLEWFLRTIAKIDYVHLPELAPPARLLDAVRTDEIDWARYEQLFRELMAERRIEEHLSRTDLDRACLLCSEPTAERCHRRLVAEHLASAWGTVQIAHL